MDIQYDIDVYGFFNLNKNRAWLRPGMIVPGYEDEQVLLDVMATTDCDHPAVFMVTSERLYCCFYSYDNDKVYREIMRGALADYNMFAVMDGRERFCCYQLIVRTEGGFYLTV